MFPGSVETQALRAALLRQQHPFAALWMEAQGLLRHAWAREGDFRDAPPAVRDAVEDVMSGAARVPRQCRECGNRRLILRKGGTAWCRTCRGIVRTESAAMAAAG